MLVKQSDNYSLRIYTLTKTAGFNQKLWLVTAMGPLRSMATKRGLNYCEIEGDQKYCNDRQPAKAK